MRDESVCACKRRVHATKGFPCVRLHHRVRWQHDVFCETNMLLLVRYHGEQQTRLVVCKLNETITLRAERTPRTMGKVTGLASEPGPDRLANAWDRNSRCHVLIYDPLATE